jgi:hypothetical protein
VSPSLPQGSVQQQLEALCDLSPVCAPALLRRQREANAQLRLDKEQLQAEVLSLRMQLGLSQVQVQQQQQVTAAPSGKQQD